MASELNRMTRAAAMRQATKTAGLAMSTLVNEQAGIDDHGSESLSLPYFCVMSSLISSM